LYLGTYDEKKLEKNIYNRFHGTLEYLEYLKSLLDLDISGTDINGGLEFLPLSNLENFCCASKRVGAKVEEIKKTLNLSEEEAESEKEKDNRKKIREIRAYQLYAIVQRNAREMQQAQNIFLQSLSQYRLAIMRIKHKTEWNDLHLLLDLQKKAVHVTRLFPYLFQNADDELRKIKQELIEKFEDVTRIEIDDLCRAQIIFIKAGELLYQRSRQCQEMEALMQVRIVPHRQF